MLSPHDIQGLKFKLLDRKEKLQTHIIDQPDKKELQNLLQEVDDALLRMENDTYGLCVICNGPIEKEFLLVDPLAKFCLEDLNNEQQRALEQDLVLAANIQQAFLPPNPVIKNGWHISYSYQPAGMVSGDYCDIVDLKDSNEKNLLFILGDVSGKGVAASMLMTHLHAMFHSFVTLQLPINRLMEQVNRLFCESTLSGHYSTLICGVLQPSGKLFLCNAGHCPPLLIKNSGIHKLAATNMPIGLFCSGSYEMKEFDLLAEDSLLLYTDGLYEEMNSAENEYGLQRICAVAEKRPANLLAALHEDLHLFNGGKKLQDDTTMLLIRRMEDDV